MTSTAIRTRIATAGALTIALVATGAAAATAVGGDGTADGTTGTGTSERAVPNQDVAVGTGAGYCGVGFQTQTDFVEPPDDSTSDNAPAAQVQLTKKCAGPVVLAYDALVSTSGSGYVHADAVARCVGKGGQPNACTPGAVVAALPGHTYLTNEPNLYDTRSATWSFSGLKRGVWRFQVRPGGDGSSYVGYGTLLVQMLKAG